MSLRNKGVSITDFGGDEVQERIVTSVKKRVVTESIAIMVNQYHEINSRIKELDERKKVLRDKILDKTAKLAQVDSDGNKFLISGDKSVKHELRVKITGKPLDDTVEKFLRGKRRTIKRSAVITTSEYVDTHKVDELIELGLLTKDEAESFLLEVSRSYALKVSELGDEDE